MLRSANAPLRRILRQQARELAAYSTPKRVEGRNRDGTINIRRLDGECVERSNICTAYQGQIIQVPCGNGFRLLGAAGTALARVQRTTPTMWVESIDPDFFTRGHSYEVTVIGRGFMTTSEFAFLLPGTEDVNPGVTIDSSAYVSATEFTLNITISEDAAIIPEGYGGLAYDNPGSAL